jgi:hypothetical protein
MATKDRLKGTSAENDPVAIDNAKLYDDSIKLRTMRNSEAGKIYRKTLLNNGISALNQLLDTDITNVSDLAMKLANFKANVKILRDYDGIEEQSENLYESLREYLEDN